MHSALKQQRKKNVIDKIGTKEEKKRRSVGNKLDKNEHIKYYRQIKFA